MGLTYITPSRLSTKAEINKKSERLEVSKPVNVLFVSHGSRLTGAERSMLEVILGLEKSRYALLVVVPEEGLLLEELRRKSIPVIKGRLKRWIARERRSRFEFKQILLGMHTRAAMIRDLIREHQIDMVYSNSIACIDGALGAVLARIPHIWHIHEILSKNQDVKTYLPIWMVRLIVAALSKRIIVPSKAVETEIGSRLATRKIRMQHNGINVDRFSSSQQPGARPNIRAELGIETGTKIVALVGYFSPIKGHLDVVEAAKSVCEEQKDTVFIFIGGGGKAYRRKVAQRADDLGLTNHFIFLDFRPEIEPFINAIDILICASQVESFSRAILEAMAAGKPVIATRCGGPEELVIDGQTGFLVPTHHPEALTTALLKLLRNPGLMHSMGEKGRKRAQESFSLDRYIRGIERVLEELQNNA